MPEELELNIDQLPFSMEAEQSVLGAILVEPECIAKVLELLTPESFYRPQHRQLFSIMLAMFTSAQPIDFVTVLEKAKSERVFASDADAKVYLTQLVQVCPAPPTSRPTRSWCRKSTTCAPSSAWPKASSPTPRRATPTPVG